MAISCGAALATKLKKWWKKNGTKSKLVKTALVFDLMCLVLCWFYPVNTLVVFLWIVPFALAVIGIIKKKKLAKWALLAAITTFIVSIIFGVVGYQNSTYYKDLHAERAKDYTIKIDSAVTKSQDNVIDATVKIPCNLTDDAKCAGGTVKGTYTKIDTATLDGCDDGCALNNGKITIKVSDENNRITSDESSYKSSMDADGNVTEYDFVRKSKNPEFANDSVMYKYDLRITIYLTDSDKAKLKKMNDAAQAKLDQKKKDADAKAAAEKAAEEAATAKAKAEADAKAQAKADEDKYNNYMNVLVDCEQYDDDANQEIYWGGSSSETNAAKEQCRESLSAAGLTTDDIEFDTEKGTPRVCFKDHSIARWMNSYSADSVSPVCE